ncbi:CD82 antigen-like [Cyprinodon tularosa]|uniref:CD82 antigen-like n=1 Tax=Cyprinodon tularosa TaxID=77115 RepID=UPI0018E1E9F7|nr:CD82 antigen-like [Cyprinodon tularosa]
MGQGCLKVSKYLLFLFNLIFFLLGVLIMGFGLWLLLDKESFILVLNDNSSVKLGCYILIGVGGFSTLMGIVGCVGTIYEVRCLLGLYFTFLLLILIAQITAGALMHFNKPEMNKEVSKIVIQVVKNYPGNLSSTERAWDYIQKNMRCCGWNGLQDWNENMVIQNSSIDLFPCSCRNSSSPAENLPDNGMCELTASDVFITGCSASVENWITTNLGVVLGICLGVAFVEILGMVLSFCLCRNVRAEDYTKVPKY